MILIEYIQTHPIIAVIVGVIHIAFAEYLKSIEIPLIVMQFTQLGAWAVTITVGLITIYGFIKRKK